jgi:D-alanyl-D-alanine carboxypeptidase/D-alanyl-D-alanine-endopeptidase (penicillin-binding protein 4)
LTSATRRRSRAAAWTAAALLLPLFASTASAGGLETIQQKIAQYLKRPGIRSTQWGIEIFDPSDNRILLSVNPDKTFKPASVLKVVTTAAALQKLGPDYKFRTGVYASTPIGPDGTLKGDLVLVGRGDPNLTDVDGEVLEQSALAELAAKVRDRGIKRVRGQVIGDDAYFDYSTHGKGWTAQDLRSIYGAPISALSVNNNVVAVHARATRPNQRVSVSVEPHTSFFRIVNRGITGTRRSKRTLYARLVPGSNTIVVAGVLPAGRFHGQHVLVANPAGVAAGILRDELRRVGVAVEGGIGSYHRGDLPAEARQGWTLVGEHISPPLVRGLEIINKRSQNLHAEMLLRTLGAEFQGAGTDEAGIKVVKQFLVEAGIESDKVSLFDGCGLSRDNLVTPRFQTALLCYLAAQPHFELFLNTLAVSGTDGTLRNRLASQPLKGVIHAKTGTLNGVATLSGYMTTRSGRNLIFSIFANNANASMGRVRKTIDEICALFVNLY